MRRRVPLVVLGGALAVAACSDADVTQPPGPAPVDLSSPAPRVHIMPTRGMAGAPFAMAGVPYDVAGGKSAKRRRGTGIYYHGGPILLVPQVAALYWGTSRIYNNGPTPGSKGSGSQDLSVVGYFMNHFAPSPYFNINNTYTNSSGGRVANSVSYTQFWADNANPGSKPSDAAIQAEIVKGFTSGNLTYDASTVYIVFTGTGVNLGGGFLTQYCAYHGNFTWNGNDVKYAAEPYDWDDQAGCSALSGSPNNDFPADVEVSTIAHETEEAATDPDLNAWYDNSGYENADKCAWTFGTTYTTANGATANMKLGGWDFLIQRNWVNAGSGGCKLAYP